MRVRNVLAALGAAALLIAGTPASAGTSWSTLCSDGIGYLEMPILTTPITLAAEIAWAPGGDHQTVWLCYSTTPVGQPGTITGGALAVDIWANTTNNPGVYVGLGCYPDFTTGVGPSCGFANSLNIAPSDIQVSTPNSTICLLSLGSGCLLWVPGLKVKTGVDPQRPLLSFQVLSTAVNLDPSECVAVVVTCP